MSEKESNVFPEHMVEYTSKCIFIKKIFWLRIDTAIKFADINNDDIILDIGCNTGHLLKEIQNSGHSCKCWGIDIEPKIMTIKLSNCEFRVADASNLPFNDDFFNTIFALDTLEHLEDVESAIKEIHRVLKPKGILILSGPTESLFYRFCRFLQFRTFEKNIKLDKPGFRRSSDHHFHSVYDLEKKFIECGFKPIKRKSLPSKLLPELFRITKFRK